MCVIIVKYGDTFSVLWCIYCCRFRQCLTAALLDETALTGFEYDDLFHLYVIYLLSIEYSRPCSQNFCFIE